MKIANRKNEDTRCRQSDCGPIMPFTSNSPKSSQLTALRPGRRNHHV